MNTNKSMNHDVRIFNMSETETQSLSVRHRKTEEIAWQYVSMGIAPIDKLVLRKFANRLALRLSKDEYFISSFWKSAIETDNARLIEAINYVIEDFYLRDSSELGSSFTKRPDAFPTDFVIAIIEGDRGSRIKHLLNYARSI